MAAIDPVLYVRVSPSGNSPEPVDQSMRVLSFEYEDDEAKADKAKLTIDNFDLSNFDAPIWKTGNHLEVSWGYEGNVSPVRQMKIQKVTGSTVLTIEALDEGIIMYKVQRSRRFDSMTRSDIAKQIADEYGYTSSAQYIETTTEVLTEVTQARMTDAAFLRDMARREGFEFWTDWTGFHFQKRDLKQSPKRLFTYYTDPGAGDIISWNVDNDLFGAGKTGGVTVKGRDPLKKTSFEAKSDNDSETDRTTLGSTGGLVATVEGGKITYSDSEDSARGSGSATVPTTEKTEDSAKRQASGMYKKAQMQAAELTMVCRGDPQMVAKSVIEVQGIGKTISGLYYCKSVKHNVTAPYTMTIKAKRDGKSSGSGTGQDFTQSKAKPDVENKGQPNTGEAPENDPSKSGGTSEELEAKVADGKITFVGG